MKIVYKVDGRIFESEKEAREFEYSERRALISKINAMKDNILPKAYKRLVLANENLSAVFKMPRKSIVKNAHEVALIVEESAMSKIALEEKICAYKKMREQLKGMQKQNEKNSK